MELNLVEGFLLLALDNKKGKFLTDSLAINHGLAGATLMKLTILQRIEIKRRKVYVISSSPTGIDYLDQMLQLIHASGKEARVRYWVHRLAAKWKKMRYRLIDSLVEQHVLVKKQKKMLGIISISIYPTGDAGPENELRTMLLDVVKGKRAVHAKSLMLLSLLEATKLTRVLFSSRSEYKDARKRIKELTKEFETNPLIHITIKEVCSVVISASTSAMVRASVNKSAV